MTEEGEKPKLKVVNFERKLPPLREDIIDALQDIMNKAKAGEIEAVYMACLMTNKDVSTVFSSTDDYFKAVGAIEWLKKKVLENE